jgi:succinate dehydrogenase / fumarate reductase cytochrome b subunit
MATRLQSFLASSIGKKICMSVTGLVLTVFLIAHLAGNLLLYADRDGGAFTAYAHKLHGTPLLLYGSEIALIGLFAVHIALALRLAMQNREARPQPYRMRAARRSKSIGGSFMVVTGLFILVFLVIHLLDFRLAAESPDDLAPMVVSRLSSGWGAAIYLVGVGAVLLHLSHAVRSALQTMGANHPRYNELLRRAGLGLAVVLGVGFASFPLVLFVAPDTFARTESQASTRGGDPPSRAARGAHAEPSAVDALSLSPTAPSPTGGPPPAQLLARPDTAGSPSR